MNWEWMLVVKHVVVSIKKNNKMTPEQEYEMMNVADDMELTGQARTKFIEEVRRELSNVTEWENFYNLLDNIATKYL
jgi:hypothetical protein